MKKSRMIKIWPIIEFVALVILTGFIVIKTLSGGNAADSEYVVPTVETTEMDEKEVPRPDDLLDEETE